MSVITTIKTNASLEEVDDAIQGYYGNVISKGDGVYEVCMSHPDNYTLLPSDANDQLEEGLYDHFRKQKKKLEFKIINTKSI